MSTKDWFSSWFDTPYYHILYKNRNDADAQLFIQNITACLQLSENAHVADLPCGKGRHSIYLNSLGYTVTGGDLSKNSIEFAKQFENEKLHFEVWDMRRQLQNKYDAIFNLFTSFGYFNGDKDNLLVLKAMKSGLKKNGIFILDFLNVVKTKNNLVSQEMKEVDGITFHIQREIKNGFILKYINFFADGQQHSYIEKVRFLSYEKMKSYFNAVDLKIINTFGDYDLNAFNKQNSNRLILIAK